jgi:hypothetical protein
MLLILLDEVEHSSGERAINVRCRFNGDVWTLDGAENVVDDTDIAELIVAD